MGRFVKDGNSCGGCELLGEFPDKCLGCSNLKSAVVLIKEMSKEKQAQEVTVEEAIMAVDNKFLNPAKRKELAKAIQEMIKFKQ